MTRALDTRLGRLVAQVQETARRRGRADLARDLESRWEALAADRPLTVVVAGRTNSGKSTLVNALLGQAAVPAGSHVPTTEAAVLGHGAGDVELAVVDTPGIDAAADGERARAVEQVMRGDVLVFLLDPLAPLTLPEARVLGEGAGVAAEVVLVLGKADLVADAAAMVATHRALIARVAPWLEHAPCFEISAREKTLADRVGDEELAADSGVPQLAAHLAERIAPHRSIVRAAGVARACRRAVQELEAADRAVLAGDDAAAALAAGAVEAHRAYVEVTAPGWTAAFARDYHRRTRQVVERDLRLRLLERRERREVAIKTGAPAMEEVVAHVKADIEEVANLMQHAIGEQGAALVSEWAARMELAAVHLPTSATTEPGQIALPALEVGAHRWDGREKAQGFAGLVNLARGAAGGRAFMGLLPGGLAMGTGVGLVMTGLSWGTSEWLRHKAQDQQGALSFVVAAFARAQIELEAALRDIAAELHPVAETALQQSIDVRRGELALEAARLQEEAERASADGQAAQVTAGARLRELEEFAGGLDALAACFTDFLRTGPEPVETATTP